MGDQGGEDGEEASGCSHPTMGELHASMEHNDEAGSVDTTNTKDGFPSVAVSAPTDPPESLKPEPLWSSSLPPSFDLKGLLDSYETPNIDHIQGIFRFGAVIGLAIYVLLLFVVARYSSASSYEDPHGPERFAHVISLILLLVSCGGRVIVLLLKKRHPSDVLFRSGFIFGTLTVQLIAISGNALMSFVQTPVYVDPVTSLRIHLVRWVEWTALAFLMTFFTTNVDVPVRRPHSRRVTYTYASSLALSTLCGLVFPFCASKALWMSNLVVSCLLFLPIYFFLYQQVKRYGSLAKLNNDGRPPSSPKQSGSRKVHVDLESKEIIRTSVVLGWVCTATWTGLVLFYVVAAVGRIVASHHPLFASPSLVSIGMCFFEVASKIWYLSVLIDAYDTVFNESSRIARRFKYLRAVTAAIWETSSDVIVVCEQSDDRIVHAVVSPAFFKLVGSSILCRSAEMVDSCDDLSLMLRCMSQTGEFESFAIDLSKSANRFDFLRNTDSTETRYMRLKDANEEVTKVMHRNVEKLVQMSVGAFSRDLSGQLYLMDLTKLSKEGMYANIHCEVKRSSLMDDSSCIFVLRDISDRVARFETEKQLLRQTTEMRKDEETSKFARHETKNGVLDALARLDQVKENIARKLSFDLKGRENDVASASVLPRDIECEFSELQGTLRDVLDAALDQAMAREVAHGQYTVRKERVNVPEVIGSLRRRASARFSLRVANGPLPEFALDRQLLRFVHRTAVSNACKYGRHGGQVETVLSFTPEAQLFVMEVLSEPGESEEESSKRCSPQVSSSLDSHSQKLSTTSSVGLSQSLLDETSGNETWIMQKCAEALGGTCAMQFKSGRTVFSFSCPVEALPVGQSMEECEGDFFLPKCTWAIAVDDSIIQRKLMDRCLRLAGIQDGRRIILGATQDEILTLETDVAQLMKQHPNDRFILIVDENLEVETHGVVGSMISGSLCVERLRMQLDHAMERRLLALIRSANDSLPDIQLYKSRAHGFLHKEPIRSNDFLNLIRPWWLARFDNAGSNIQPISQSGPTSAADGCGDEASGPSTDGVLESATCVAGALVTVCDENLQELRSELCRDNI
jgi:hypothetical protein